jgi:hypothetical protein
MLSYSSVATSFDGWQKLAIVRTTPNPASSTYTSRSSLGAYLNAHWHKVDILASYVAANDHCTKDRSVLEPWSRGTYLILDMNVADLQ